MNVYLMYILVVFALVLAVRFLWARRRWYALSLKLNGHFGLPFVGIAYRFVDATKVIDWMEIHSKRHGNLSQIWIGPRLFVFVNQPSHVEQILNSPSCIDKGASYRFIDAFIGCGLISMKSQDWKVHRKLLNPCFSYNITNQFLPIFNRHLRIMTKCLDSKCDQPDFDILHILKNCSMDMICETTMDKLTMTQKGDDVEYFKAIEQALAVIGSRMFNPLFQPELLFRLSGFFKSSLRNKAIIMNRVRDIVEEKMSAAKKSKPVANKSDDNEFTKEKSIFIDRVLKLSMEDKTFTLDDVIIETNTVMLAGFETTATTAAFIQLMLAMYPDLQQRVYEEMKCIHLTDKADVTQNDLADLPYLDMFIKETLRLFPSVPFLTRTATSDIKIGSHTIPEGVEFVLGVLAMHRSTDNFKLDPKTFNPDNFLPENVSERHAYSYIPFSGGPRGCIGTKYANIVLKLITVYVVKNYHLTTKLKLDDLKFRMNVTLNLLNTHLVRIRRRH